jgi:TalC/MipB family fructose-6-phosphate aldolase
MELWVDTTNKETISKCVSYGMCYGITTNPSILAGELENNSQVIKVIEELLAIQDGPVAIQVTATDADEIYQQAKFLAKISHRIIVKVPVSQEGISQMRKMLDNNIMVMATAIYHAHQYFLVGNIGVQYAAPYISKILNNPTSGLPELQKMVNICNAQKFKTKIIGGSVNDIEQVTLCAGLGIQALTLATNVINKLILTTADTDKWVNSFSEDWQRSGLKLFAAEKMLSNS